MLHIKLKKSWSQKRFSPWFLTCAASLKKILARPIPISVYKIVQTIGNTAAGGEKAGFASSAYDIVPTLVNRPATVPTANTSKIEPI